MPKYLIDHKRLEELWASSAPALFVTDFLRTDWEHDKPWLPSQDCRPVQLTVGGHRRVFANTVAWKQLADAGLVSAEGTALPLPVTVQPPCVKGQE